MNVLLLTTHLNPGGISRYILNLASGLKEANHKVIVVSSGGQWVQKLSSNNILHQLIPIKTKSFLSPKVFRCAKKLSKLVRDEKIDIIHCNTRVTQSVGALLSRKTKIAYVSSFHGFYKPSILRRVFPFSGKRAIAISEAVKKHMVKDLKIKPDYIDIVPNGFDIKKFSTRSKNKLDYGFSSDDFVIGMLGRISQEKGHFLAVKALKLLAKRYPNAKLAISGEGKLKNQLKEFIAESQMQERIVFLDVDPNDFLDTLDVLIMPSKKEGFGYAIVEAFAKGVAVIGYNVGGIAEIIRDRCNGILFYNYDPLSLKNTIEELLVNPQLRKQFSQIAKNDVWQYTIKNMAKTDEPIGKNFPSILSFSIKPLPTL